MNGPPGEALGFSGVILWLLPHHADPGLGVGAADRLVHQGDGVVGVANDALPLGVAGELPPGQDVFPGAGPSGWKSAAGLRKVHCTSLRVRSASSALPWARGRNSAGKPGPSENTAVCSSLILIDSITQIFCF